ncbi:MAG: YraN family protein [Candidatus Eisenbacteria bacterium]|nr:YraN family protein [Candidatus Eisenbacteria bacterium]
MTERAESGRLGERLAAAFLENAGHRILDRNYRTPRGEIDLITEEGGDLVFVEVRLRSGTGFGGAAGSVGPGKRRRLVRAAERYLLEAGDPDRPCRFDVVSITAEGDSHRIEHLRNAFDGEGRATGTWSSGRPPR